MNRSHTIPGLFVLALLGAGAEEVPFNAMTRGAGKRIEWLTAKYDTFTQSVSYRIGEKSLTIFRSERADAQPDTPWISGAIDYSTEMRLVSIAYRDGGDWLFLAGTTDAGVSTIVSWRFQVPDGKHAARPAVPSATSVPALGTAQSAFAGSFGIQGGVSFNPTRLGQIPYTRSVIFEGTQFGYVQSITADPEGRLLIAKFYPSNKLYRIELGGATPSAPQPIFDAEQVPHLLKVKNIALRDHSLLGRVLVMDAQENLKNDSGDLPYSTLLYDANNDGEFESFTTFTRTEWFSSASMTSPSFWSSFYGT